MFLTLGAKPCAIFDHFNLSRANIFWCNRVTLSHLASWMWLQARQARRGSGESTRAPFHLRSVPRSTRPVPCRALLRGCNGWTVDTRRPNKCKLVNLSLPKNRWDGTRKCLFVYNISIFLSNKLLFILQFRAAEAMRQPNKTYLQYN